MTKTRLAAVLLALGIGGLIYVQWPEIRREAKMWRM